MQEAVKSRLPWPVWAFATGKVAFHLATTRLEHHRDELYFIAASKRLAASYVDFQPVTPFLVRVARALFGESLVGLRLIPALAGAIAVVLGALIARELGGDRRAQIFAALALLIVPAFVGMDAAVNTVSLETPAFMFVALIFARLIRTSDERFFIPLGAAAGLSVLVKFTALGYLFGLGVAFLATPLRRSLRSPWLSGGAFLALAMVVPSLIWQFSHDLPVVEFVSHQGGGGAVFGLRGRPGYVVSLFLLPGPFAAALTIPGMRWLLRESKARPLGIAVAASLVTFLVASGKGYYALPGIAVVVCAGAIVASGWQLRARRILVSALVVNLLVALPLLVPVIPTSLLRGRPDLADATELGERIGWKDLARDVGRIVRTLPRSEQEKAIVLGSNYTLPAAIEFYADEFDLPVAVAGHNSAYLWWPSIRRDHVAVVLGFEEGFLEKYYDDVQRVGTIRNREGVDNYEWGKPIFVAREPRVTPAELREAIRVFTA